MHVHTLGSDGEAKFWLAPVVSCAMSSGLTDREIARLQRLVENHREELINAWHHHFDA